MGANRNVNFYGDDTSKQTNSEREYEVFWCVGAVNAGDTVSRSTDTTYGLGRSVAKGANVTADAVKFVGIALDTLTGDGWLRVATPGSKRTVVQNANVVTGVTALQPLTYSGTTNGRLMAATIGTDHIVAIALENSAANVADIELL